LYIWFPRSFSLFAQHELGLAADEDARQLVEQSEGEVSPADKAAAMKAAVEKRSVALRMKMSKLVAVANPDLTDGWLREVHSLILCPYQSFELIYVTEELTSPMSFRLSDITR
jgi:hypothetical protein